MNTTAIPYAKFSWNPMTGCLKGCDYCYARRIAQHYVAKDGERFVIESAFRWNGQAFYFATDDSPAFPMGWAPTFYSRRLAEPQARRKPATIFVCDMADLFGDWVPMPWISMVLDAMASAPQHTYLLLTKNPARMVECLLHAPNLPPHLWTGTTVTNQQDADERVPEVLQADARAEGIFLSLEPMLGPVDLSRWLGKIVAPHIREAIVNASSDVVYGLSEPVTEVNWVICGGQSGPGAAPMHPDWVRALRRQCAKAAVPFYFKSWGNWLPEDQEVAYSHSRPLLVGKTHAWSDGLQSVRMKAPRYAGAKLDGIAHQDVPWRQGPF